LFFKKIIVIIFLFAPLMIMAQNAKENNSSKMGKLETKKEIKKNTYADDEIRLSKLTTPIYDEIHSNNELIAKKYNLLNKLSDPTAKIKTQKDIDSLFKINDELESQATSVQFNFIRNNPSSFLSLDRLTLMLKNNAELSINDTIKLLFYNLNKYIQNSASGKKFKLILVNEKKSEVGSIAPDFNLKDINNKEISLSGFQHNKFVLLDFWASWCEPCRDDMPFLKSIFKTYSKKGLEIIGISKDDDLLSWRKAIDKDSTQIWRHISAPLKFQEIDSSEVTNKFAVYPIPVKILINKEGVIIGRWMGGGTEIMANLQKLLNKSFNN